MPVIMIRLNSAISSSFPECYPPFLLSYPQYTPSYPLYIVDNSVSIIQCRLILTLK